MKTKIDQVKNHLQNDGFNLIEMKDDFPQYQSVRLFHKTNTHWNDYGMFIGYQNLMKSIKRYYPEIFVLQLNNFKIINFDSSIQDLTYMLSINVKEDCQKLEPTFKPNAFDVKNNIPIPKGYWRDTADFERHYKSNANSLKLLVFHDSFFKHIPKLLAESFGESIFLWYTPDANIIKRVKPDLVIYERIERDIEALTYPWN